MRSLFYNAQVVQVNEHSLTFLAHPSTYLLIYEDANVVVCWYNFRYAKNKEGNADVLYGQRFLSAAQQKARRTRLGQGVEDFREQQGE